MDAAFVIGARTMCEEGMNESFRGIHRVLHASSRYRPRKATSNDDDDMLRNVLHVSPVDVDQPLL